MATTPEPEPTARQSSAKLLGRGSIYTLATAAPMLAALLITPALTRALRQTEYGYVSLGVTAMQFTINLLAMGLPTAITRHAIVEATGPEGARGIASRGALIALAVSATASLIGLALAVSGFGLPAAVLLAVLAGGAGAGVAMAQALSLAEDKPWRYVALAFGLSLLAPVGGLITVLTLSSTASAYFVALASVYLLVDVFAFAQIARTHVQWDLSDFRAALRIALPMIPHQLAIGTTTAVAVWIATARLGIDAAAETQPSLQLATMPLVVTSALSYAWTPIVLRARREAQGPLLEETASVVCWLASLGGAVVALLAPWVLRFLTPYDLQGMVPLTALTSLTAAIAAAYLAHLQLVFAAGATQPLALLSPLAVVAGGLAAAALVPVLGLPAMGLGYLITYGLLYLGTRSVARRAGAVAWNERALAAPLLVGLGLCAAGAWLGWGSGIEIAARLLLAGLASGIALRKLTSRLRGARARQPQEVDE